MKPSFRRRIALLALLAAPLAGGCQRVYPVRTLPNWVRGIYIPMVQNHTIETGLEELATRSAQEEFLADGRVQIVPKHSADLQLVAVIEEYKKVIRSRSGDRIPNIEEVYVIASLKLYDPDSDPFAPGEAIANLGTVEATLRFNADPRSTGLGLEPDVKQLVMANLARQIVNKTISGFPTALKDAPSGAVLPQAPISPGARTGTVGPVRNRLAN